MQRSGVGAALVKHACPSCMLGELTALTSWDLRASLKEFDRANGENLGTWTPGFPELQVQTNSTLSGPKVQCSLLFMTRGLEEILEDKKEDLNPNDTALHRTHNDSISRVKMLTACVKHVLGGNCSAVPPPPTMPPHIFERKQWNRTLLENASSYLSWLEWKILSFLRKLTVKRS